MKTTKAFIFLFALSLLSACKSTQNTEILPQISVEEGKYNLKIYDSSGKLVLTREGVADYTGHNNSITLIDPDFGKLGFNDYFAGFYLTHKKNLDNENYFEEGLFNEKEIVANLSSAWYSLPERDWNYSLVNGSVQIIKISKNNIVGLLKFEMKEDSLWLKGKNKKWGENIRVEAEFFAK